MLIFTDCTYRGLSEAMKYEDKGFKRKLGRPTVYTQKTCPLMYYEYCISMSVPRILVLFHTNKKYINSTFTALKISFRSFKNYNWQYMLRFWGIPIWVWVSEESSCSETQVYQISDISSMMPVNNIVLTSSPTMLSMHWTMTSVLTMTIEHRKLYVHGLDYIMVCLCSLV